MFLVVYKYVGEKERGDYHVDCDWQICRVDDFKRAILLFWNQEEGGYYRRRNEHKKDFIIKKVLCDEKEISDFIDEYWKNESEYQE